MFEKERIIHEVDQKTVEWHNLKLGKFSGSDFHMYFGKSLMRDNGILNKASERITGVKSDGKKFTSIHIDRGNELEDEACLMYEMQNNTEVRNVGFIELNEFIGCSPDGLVGDDGIIEIKCKDNHTFLKQKIKGVKGIEPTYRTQVQFNLLVSNRKWCDFIIYNKNFENSLIVYRIERDEEYIQKIKDCLLESIDEVKSTIEQFEQAK